MKKFLSFLLTAATAFALLFGCVGVSFCDGNTVVYAEESSTDYQSDLAYVLTKQFCEQFPSRSDQENEFAVANFLNEQFSSVEGVSSSIQGGVNVTVSDGKYQTANVIAKIDTSSNEVIVVGAHFDNIGTADGAADNACGIAALYMLMMRLALLRTQLPFDVWFVAFGGEEQGLYGSKHFVDNLTDEELSSVLLMINFDCIANGDELYLQCENKRTDLEDLFVSKSSGKASTLNRKPYASGVLSFLDIYGYGYYEATQGSDHTSFRLKGVPTAFFYAGAYGSTLSGYTESANEDKCISNTAQDSFANLDKLNGKEFVNRINTVVDTIVDTMLSPEFVAVAQNARSQLVNLWAVFGVLPSIVLLVLAVAVLYCAYAYRRKVIADSKVGMAQAKPRAKIFVSPDAESIFTFTDDNGSSDNG